MTNEGKFPKLVIRISFSDINFYVKQDKDTFN